MPELPEVETIVRQLARVLPGKIIVSVEALKKKSVRGEVNNLMDKRILMIGRKQKMIVMEVSTDLMLLIHLKMTGQLIFLPTGNQQRVVGGHPTNDWVGELPSKHTRAVINFSDKSKLYFNDQRMFGWVKIVNKSQWIEDKEKMAPDVVDEGFTAKYLEKVLSRSTRAVKLVILDQAKMGGMGNIYANDALYLAKINPLRKANSLKRREVLRLWAAMKEVIAKGIETGGASYSHFVDTKGVGGHYQDYFLVYGKEGEKCGDCGKEIEKISIGGRGSYFCPKCQR